MPRFCYYQRDELTIVDLEKLALVKAEGNYTEFFYMGGEKTTLTTGLSNVEQLIKQSFASNALPCPYVRLGRSCIINENYLFKIDAIKQRIILSDFAGRHIVIKVSKQVARTYKETINRLFHAEDSEENE